MNTPDTEWSSVKEQVYNLVKEVHIQKPFEDVTGEPHYVTDQIMKLISSRDTYWKERVENIIEEYRKSISSIKGSVVCAEKTITKLDTLLDNLK